MQTDQQVLFDIVSSIRLIFEYTKDVDWKAISIKNQDAIIRRFTIIGEAAKRLSKEFRSAYPDIPWKKMAGLRDIVVHKYDEVDLDIIRDIVEIELPLVLSQIETLLSQE